jgi:hypothetical protein
MTDAHTGSVTALYVRKRLAADRKRRADECVVILARAYLDVLSKLNGDVSEAFRLFDKFTRTAAKGRMPTRRRGKADPELDARILAAGDAAPSRQREAAVATAAGATTLKQIGAARKRYDRLRAERDANEKRVAKVIAAVRHKLPRRSPQPLFESTVQTQPQGRVEGDKYSF